ncbi:uncharacterized protein A1O5_01507, partial [Cladophialophora psammophila CBS 110553]
AMFLLVMWPSNSSTVRIHHRRYAKKFMRSCLDDPASLECSGMAFMPLFACGFCHLHELTYLR